MGANGPGDDHGKGHRCPTWHRRLPARARPPGRGERGSDDDYQGSDSVTRSLPIADKTTTKRPRAEPGHAADDVAWRISSSGAPVSVGPAWARNPQTAIRPAKRPVGCDVADLGAKQDHRSILGPSTPTAYARQSVRGVQPESRKPYVSWYSGPSPPSGSVRRPPLAVIAPHWTQLEAVTWTSTSAAGSPAAPRGSRRPGPGTSRPRSSNPDLDGWDFSPKRPARALDHRADRARSGGDDRAGDGARHAGGQGKAAEASLHNLPNMCGANTARG